MRSRSELYNILVDELKMDNAKATEILDKAFALHDDEKKKKEEREAKLKELKEKYVGKLIICRDAYWKLYGEEMGLGKPWEPPYGYEPIDTFCLQVYQNRITKVTDNTLNHCILTFPTPEMRDAFKENFSKEIESCKELL